MGDDWTDYEGYIQQAILDLLVAEHGAVNYLIGDGTQFEQIQKALDRLNSVWKAGVEYRGKYLKG